jgi:glycosyltransferase involved in cell wall biosynthesis
MISSLKNLVSVIIPTYNRASLIERSILSVLNQTHENIECIVVDDCSTDSTEVVIKSIKDSRLVYLRNDKNLNASASRNVGIRLAGGNFIAFQDSDDEWLPQKIEKQINLLTNLPNNYAMVYCWQDYYDNDVLIHQHHMTKSGFLFPDVLSRIMTGGAQTLLLKKEILGEVGLFDERITNGDDQDFIRRVAKNYHISFVPEVLVKIYINHNSEVRLSDSKIRKNNLELISSFKMELEKFSETFNKRYDLKASVYSSIAYHYALLGEKRNFIKYNSKAWLLWPFRGRFKSTLRGIKILKQNEFR